MARTNTTTGGGGGGAWSSITGTPTEIPYFDALGNGTSDADHTLLADGTLRLASTHGDVTGRFYQGDEPLVGNQHIWGNIAEDAVTGSLAADLFVDGTASAEFGNDIALIKAGQFASIGTGYTETIYSGGLEKGMEFGSTGTYYTETVLPIGYQVSYSDEATSGGLLWANLQGMGILSQDWTSTALGYQVDAYFGQIFADDTGTSTRVGTGKDIVDYVQVGTIISTVTFSGGGLDDFTPGGTYTGSFTGTYTVGCTGNDGARVVFNGGMTTGNEFNVGEVVTGSISGATARVSQGTSDTRIWVYDVVGIFALGDILTGDQGNVSTAVTTGGGATGDLFQINYTDLTNQNIQWFTGNQANPVPFNGIGGITFAFASATGHMPNDNWSFTASANYSTRYVANDTSVSTGDVDDATTKTKQVIDITNQTISGWSDGANKNVLVGKELSLPDNTVTSVFEVALPAGAMTGGYFTATIIATDGTDLQAHSDHVTYAAVNKAGTMTASITASNGDDAVALSSGTLAITWTINTGTAGKITIEVTANSSLAAPTITLAGLNIDNNNGHVVTIL